MRTRLLLILIIPFSMSFTTQQIPQSNGGHIDRLAGFESKYVDARNIDVWAPDDYNPALKYAVLYMHDGQMLFDSTTTWNKQEWGVDEIASQLIKSGLIKPCIVVGIWNNGNKRNAEYLPQKAWVLIDESEKVKILMEENIPAEPIIFEEGLLADAYLKFIVEELKPYIDTHYATLPNMDNTFIMGSSMGGLISYYAIAEYPNIFGGAACISTHWPAVQGIVLNYVAKNIPNPKCHRLYFDYGTATLDSLYEPYQHKVDGIILKKGYREGENYLSKKFEGADHSEISWRSRLQIPLQFLLKPE